MDLNSLMDQDEIERKVKGKLMQVYGREEPKSSKTINSFLRSNQNWWNKLNLAYLNNETQVDEYTEEDFYEYNRTSKIKMENRIETYPGVGVNPVHMEGTRIKLLPRRSLKVSQSTKSIDRAKVDAMMNTTL